MSINLGSATAYLKMDVSGLLKGKADAKRALEQSAADTKRTVEKMNADVRRSMDSLGSTLTRAVTAPLAALGIAAVSTATKMDSLKRGLVAVTGSTQEAEKQMKRLKEAAKLPGLSFEQAVQGSIRLQAAGLSATQAEKALRGFGNALATVGKGSAELDGVTLALSQISSKGKVFAEEINQINERVPQIRKAMQEMFGTSDTEKLQKMGITATQFIDKMNEYFLKQKMVSGGAQNALENLQRAAKSALGSIGDILLPHVTRAAEFLAEKLEKLAEWFKTLSPAIQNALGGLAVGGLIMGPALLGVSRLLGGIQAIRASLATPFVLKLTVVGAVIYELLDALNRVLEKVPLPTSPNEKLGIDSMVGRSGVFSPPQAARDAVLSDMKRRAEQEADRRAREGMATGRLAFSERMKGLPAIPRAAQPWRETNNRLLMQAEVDNLTTQMKALEDAAKVPGAAADRAYAQFQVLEKKKLRLEEKIRQLSPGYQARQAVRGARQQEGFVKRLYSMVWGVGGDAGGSLASGIETATKDAAKALDDLLSSLSSVGEGVRGGLGGIEALTELRDRLFDATHDEFDIKRRDAERQLIKDWPVSWVDAARLYIKSLADIRKAQEEFVRAPGAGIGAGLAGVGGTLPGLAAAQAAAGKAKIVGAGQGVGGGLGAISNTIQAHVERAQEALARKFNFGRELGRNLADEFAYGFSSAIERALGRNPISRAFSRALERQLTGVFDQLFASIFKGGSLNGIAGPANLGGGGFLGGLLNMGVGSLISGGIGSLVGGLFGGGKGSGGGLGSVVGSIAGGIGGLLGFDSGGIVPGPRGASRLAVVHGGETILPTHRDGGAGGIHFHGPVHISKEVDADRFLDRLSTLSRRAGPVRPGKGRAG